MGQILNVLKDSLNQTESGIPTDGPDVFQEMEPRAPSPEPPTPSPHPHVYVIPLPPSWLQNGYILMLHKSETQTFFRTPTVSYGFISFKWPVPLTTNVKCSWSGARQEVCVCSGRRRRLAALWETLVAIGREVVNSVIPLTSYEKEVVIWINSFRVSPL